MTTTNDYSKLDEKLEILIDQVALLTEAVTIGFQDFRQELTVVKKFRQDFAEIKEMIKEQSATTARLVKIVEALIQRS
ncbi:hypothetical protein AB3R30_16175 [Leptolyngbyaceae cyanobacterium UHCC 1019]